MKNYEVRNEIENTLKERNDRGKLVGFLYMTSEDVMAKLTDLGVIKLRSDGSVILPQEEDDPAWCSCKWGCAKGMGKSHFGECRAARHATSLNRDQQPASPGPAEGPGAGQADLGGREAPGAERPDPRPVPAGLPEGERSGQPGPSFRDVRPGSRTRSVEMPRPAAAEQLPDVQHDGEVRGGVHFASSPIRTKPPAQRPAGEGADEASPPVRSAAQRLRDLAALREQRQLIYGDHFMQVGKVLLAFFPDGVTLRTEADLCRFKNLTQVIDKIHRYCVNFSKGGHEDSLDDMSNYGMIQAYMDEVFRRQEDEQ